jgi:hypothetical protein
MVVPLGDNAYVNGQPSEYQNCYDVAWGSTLARTRPIIGGHDEGTVAGGPPAGTGYVNYFANQLAPFAPTANDLTKLYYSYDIGAWHVVVLNDGCIENQTPGCSEKAQEAWLKSDLAAHPTLCTLALHHEPRWSSDNVHGNTQPIEAFWNVEYQYGVDLDLNGSAHWYERFAPQDAAGNLDNAYGVREIVAGTGGYGLYALGTLQPNSQTYSSSFGVLKLTLHATSYDWQFMPISGYTYTDSGSTSCHPAPPAPAPQTPSVRASTQAQGNPVASLALATPQGTVAGDLLLALVAHQAGTACTLPPPAGWTAVPNGDYSDGTNARVHAYFHFATASEPASTTFALGGCGSQAMAAAMLDVVGANATAPVNASLGQVNTTSTAQMPAPSISPTVPNTLLVYAGAMNLAGTLEPPPFMAEQAMTAAPGVYQVGLEVATQGLAAFGATGTRSGYVIFNNGRSVTDMIAIAPA